MKLTVVLPAFNEERDLPALLDRIDSSLRDWSAYRILVIDDGSTDGTAQIVQHACSSLPVTLVQHPRNLGLGAAIRTGLKLACSAPCDAIVTMDSDNSQPPELIKKMADEIDGKRSDVVIASRFQPGAQEVGVPAFRVFLSHVSSGIIRIVFPYQRARDYTCGFRAYRPETIQTLVSQYGDNFIRENSFACMLELLLNCRRIGARVSEVPMILRYDLKEGESKMRIWRTVKRYAVTALRAKLPLAKSCPASSTGSVQTAGDAISSSAKQEI